MTTTGTRLTYEEYLKEPETMLRYDIVDGEIVMSAAPHVEHQRTLKRAFRPIDRFVVQQDMGEILFAPVDIILQRDPLRTRQPDLMFVSNERASIIQDGRVHGGPDLIMEIISHSDTRAEIESRLADYASLNVRECWLVYPQIHAVEVLRLEGGKWQRAYIRGAGELLESAVLPGLELDIAAFFEGA